MDFESLFSEIDRIRRLYSDKVGEEPFADRAMALTIMDTLEVVEKDKDCLLLEDKERESFYVIDFEEFIYNCGKDRSLAEDLFKRLVRFRESFRSFEA